MKIFHPVLICQLWLGIALLTFSPDLFAAENQISKYVRFKKDETIAYGLLEQDRVRQLSGDLFTDWKPTQTTYPLSEVKLLVPVEPTKVLAMALNYHSHTGQLEDQSIPEVPQLFFKAPSCLIADGEEIIHYKDSTNIHYEAEMVIVLGKRAKNVPVEKAKDYVFGVSCGNDVTARDWQQQDMQWWRAKGADTFGPCGPIIVSGVDYDDLLLQIRVNGELKFKQRTSDMVRNVSEIVSYTSRYVTLEPGDLIYTGAMGITSSIKPGDLVEVELEHAGVLKNKVVAEE